MTGLVRRLRGAVTIGLVWGTMWVAIGVVLLVVLGVVRPDDIGPGEGPGTALPILGLVGFPSGLGFAGLLAVAERRTSLRELSLTRVALWGLLGSAAVPWLMGADGSMGWVTGPVGATLAAASVAIAQRRARRESESRSPAG